MSFVNKYLKSDSWQIGTVNVTEQNIINTDLGNPNILSHTLKAQTSFLADPFGFQLNGELYVLCEHYHFSTGIANIVCCKVTANRHLSDPIVVLDTGSHLSFPYVFHHNDDVYFCPEASASKTLSIYKMDGSPYSWKLFHLIDESLPAIDPVIFQKDNLWWCLYSTTVHGSHSSLHARFAENMSGPWHKHIRDPLLIREKLARNGGTPFQVDDYWYRVVQDSTNTYGGELKLFRIDELTVDEYSETEVGRLTLDLTPPYNEGFHTLSLIQGSSIAFVDTKRRVLSSRAALNSLYRAKRKLRIMSN